MTLSTQQTLSKLISAFVLMLSASLTKVTTSKLALLLPLLAFILYYSCISLIRNKEATKELASDLDTKVTNNKHGNGKATGSNCITGILKSTAENKLEG